MRDFQIKEVSKLLYDIHQWIGDAVEFIGTTATLTKKSTPNEGSPGAYMVKNHRVALPYDNYELLFVEYKGMRLRKGLDKTGYNLDSSDRTTKVNQTVNANGHLTYLDGTPVNEEDFSAIPNYTGEYYQINKNFIQTSFETGHVKLHYTAIPVDECGLPLIPNGAMYKQAVVWYVTQSLLLAGYVHPVISWEMANLKWEDFLPKAQNEMKMPNIDDMDTFKNMWVRLVPLTKLPDDFFMGGESSEMLDI